MDITQMWKISGKIELEVLVSSQLEMAGSQKERLLEKYRKNMKTARNNNLFQTLFVSFFLAMIFIIPFKTMLNVMNSDLTSSPISEMLFIFALSLLIYHLLHFVFFITFKLMVVMQLLKGDAFKFLSLQPIPSSSLYALVFLSYMRINLLEVIVMIFTFPVISLIVSGNLLFFFALLFSNIIYTIFLFNLQIRLANLVAKKILIEGRGSRKQTFIKILYTTVYFFVFISSYFSITLLGNYIDDLFHSGIQSNINLEILNIALSIIPYPFAGAYLPAVCFFPISNLDLFQIILPLISIFAFTVFLRPMIRITRNLLKNAARDETPVEAPKESIIKISNVRIKTDTILKTLVKTNYTNIVRDFGNLIYFMMVIIMPVAGVLSRLFSSNHQIDAADLWITNSIYTCIILFMAHQAVSGADLNVGSLISSLPLRTLHIYKSRLIVMTTNILIGIGFNSFISLFLTNEWEEFMALQLVSITQSLLLISLFLILYSALFGKINKKYSLFIIHSRFKGLKYFVIIFCSALITIFEIVTILILNLMFSLSYLTLALMFSVINSILFIQLSQVARKIFF
ncbi:MAG: hypothetical protein ACTSVI_00760 [Promethearchaeota archaeon]